jgi:hypothetical protein
VLQGAMEAPLSILIVLDIIGDVVGDREKMTIIQNWDDICLEGLDAAKKVRISITKAS